VSVAQVRPAWTLQQGPHVPAIPGTCDPDHITQNVAAGALRLSEGEMARLTSLRSSGVMVDQVPAVPLSDDAPAFALVDGGEDTERFTFGGATVVIGPAGTVIVTEDLSRVGPAH
jgi:hypothetical protein